MDVIGDIRNVDLALLEAAYNLYWEALLQEDFEDITRTGKNFFALLGSDRKVVSRFKDSIVLITRIFYKMNYVI